MVAFLVNLVLLLAVISYTTASFETDDVYVPADCTTVAKYGDHLLLEYSIRFLNGSEGAYLKKPSQLFHVFLDNANEDLPVISSLKGACKNATRRITWEDPSEINLLPIFLSAEKKVTESDVGLYIDITVVHITTPDEYQIFSSFREGNITNVIELIDSHVGVNAVDEWEQTPLMIAIQLQRVEVISALLNTRMPRVDVNFPKSSGFNALFYAIQKGSPQVVEFLLRRGADPNVKLAVEGSKGNTPLHIACLLEKNKQAELLLSYGAQPNARNEHGNTPIQLLPNDSLRSTKLYFKKIFEDAYTNLNSKGGDVSGTFSQSAKNDL